jgi:hypothetical protein
MIAVARDIPRVFPPRSVVAVLLLLACGQPEAGDPGVMVEDSADVRIVRSTGADRPLDWRFSEVFRLGGADAGAESFFDIRRGGVRVGPDGRIYVLDYGNYRVLVFAADGEHLASFGRRGRGPSELTVPVGLTVEPNGTVAVLDRAKQGLVRFAPDGEPLGVLGIEFLYVDGLARVEEGLILEVAEGYRTDQPTVYDRLVLVRAGGEVVELASLARTRPSMVQYTGCVEIALEPLFAPELVWDANGRRVVVNDTAAYVVDVFEGARRVASFRRDLSPQPVTREDAIAALGTGKTIRTPYGECRIDPAEELEGRGFADVLPPIAWLALAPDGTVWVRRNALPGRPRRTDVLGPDGRYLGTLPPGSPLPIAFLSPDALIARVIDELDIEYLVAYSIDR